MTATTAPRPRQYAIRGSGDGRAPAAAPAQPSSVGSVEQQTYLARWLRVWIALLSVVALVVVVYLVAITNSLASINTNLAIADEAVGGAGGDTATLPDQVEQINNNLAAIDTALAAIPGQADVIIGELSSIDASLASTDGSLVNTSASLQATSGQLVQTADILETVLGQAGTIRGTLAAADRPNGDCGPTSCGADQLGVQNIHQRVAIANDVLDLAKGDSTNIIAGLDVTNRHLASICTTTGVLRLGGGSCPS
ncbi:MAG: hypothetical protein H0W25_00040 [Acidimicrobiia bacterium]|nr:hypothetical protein [Acidimicrobiia bacterium]